MQSVSDNLRIAAASSMRELSWKLYISFEKNYDPSVTFFTIGGSLIGGMNPLKPTSSSVIQEWDKYTYTDYSDRVIDIEWTRSVDPVSSVVLAMADVILDNHDDLFSPGGDSPLNAYLLPYRPIRIYSGFQGEVIPQFIGLTEGIPVVDERTKTVRLHCIDFTYQLFNKTLDESLVYINQTTDQVLTSLFAEFGISSDQLDLDTGLNTISYAYFEKGSLFVEALRELMEAESGRIYMDELGVIKFRNRQSYNSDYVMNFDAYQNILEAKSRYDDGLINVVQIKGQTRSLQVNQKYWDKPTADLVQAGDTIEVWASFDDPVYSVDEPINSSSATTSSFTANTSEDGTGTDSTDISLESMDVFATSVKMTFKNNGATDLYLTNVTLYAQPITVTHDIYIREVDEDSVTAYGERVLDIENNLFQDSSEAQGKALTILRDFATFGGIQDIEVKGTPALQLDDTIRVDLYNRVQNYKITKIQNKISLPARFKQVLTLRNFTPAQYFTIAQSLIGGTDELHP